MIIDLRSDTVTKPTPAMREAMSKADVGDDVFGEDPTVNLLQEKVAAILGKDAALFMASGTMSNQVAVKTHTQPGDEVLVERESHIFNYECGTPAVFSGVQLLPLNGKKGVFTADEVKASIRPPNVHHPRTRLVAIENTHNRAGGTVWSLHEIEAIHTVAKTHGMKMHLDGARLWNASVAAGIPLKTYASFFDSVSVCFSKGLGAPVGSMLAGSNDFIEQARRFRKMLGGGMRQAGVLAAAAIYAIDYHIERLAQDHQNARRLAEALSRLPGIKIELDDVQTNIVLIHVHGAKMSAQEIVQALKKQDVLILDIGPDRLRAVFHMDISDQQVFDAIHAFETHIGLLGKD